jgi:cysteinyl-tRNA synthetase
MTPKTTLKLFNTLSGNIETFVARDPNQVKIYCCGPTVYSFQHIGNFKTFIFEDILVRTLRFLGYGVKHVMNITDVGHLTDDADSGEDKMIIAMRREGKTSEQIANFYTDIFFKDWDALNLVKPSVICKATEHIQQMIALVERLQQAGYAYEAGGNIYFNVDKFKSYGEFARLDLEGLRAGARTGVDSNKKGPFDFALWFTRSKFENQELTWDSPWGKGYPGWHIECSAMGLCHLGEYVDIHCGGIDHIPVHHTNEIAQSEAAIGHQWVSTWMHGEFMQINAEKMSKSTGNLICISDLAERKISPLAYRYLCIMSHYRSQLNFTWEAIENAQAGFIKLSRTIRELAEQVKEGSCSTPVPKSPSFNKAKTKPLPQPDNTRIEEIINEFSAALCSDLNTPRAMSVVVAALKDDTIPPLDRLNMAFKVDEVFGLGFSKIEKTDTNSLPDEVQNLLTERAMARKQKQWAKADQLRDQLLELGYKIKDTPKGQQIE